MSRIVKQGTGSDTRMYSPRSESEEYMYADDDEVYAPGDAEARENESREKKEAREEQQRKWVGLKHLKISTGKDEKEEEPFEESNPQSEQTELSEQTGSAGSRGEDLDQAVGARTGTGSAMGEIPPQLPQMGVFGLTRSEPMDISWQLLKNNLELRPPMTQGVEEESLTQEDIPMVDMQTTAHYNDPCDCAEEVRREFKRYIEEYIEFLDSDDSKKEQYSDLAEISREDAVEMLHRTDEWDCEDLLELDKMTEMGICYNNNDGMSEDDQMKYASEPMDFMWDNLLLKVLGDPVGTSTLESTDRAMRSGIGPGGAKGRKGHRVTAFPRPIGGRSPWASTKRRASVHQRLFGNIKGGGGKSLRSKSKTGMMRQRYTLSPHHLGVGSLYGKPRPGRLENPGKYISWLGRQSAYRGAGGSGVMLPYTPHAPREQLGQLGYPGQAGSGRMRLMPGQARLMRESGRRATRGPPRPRGMRRGVPSPLASPATASPLASMFAKSDLEELVEVSKAYVRQLGPGLTSFDSHDLKDLLRELKHLLSRLPRKSLMGISGGGSNNDGMVEAPANGPQKTSRNEGGTETDPEDDPRYWGADAAGMYSRRGGAHV